MPHSTPRRPTDFELETLEVLWDQGPSTVREVMETLSRRRHVGYTTVLKMLQIMGGKGLVVRDESQRAHVYRARHSQRRMLRSLAADLVERGLDGSVAELVRYAVECKRVTRDEVAELLCVLDGMEKRQGAHVERV